MADEKLLAILRQGVDAWNRWREENPGVKVDLVRADLRKADLCKADLGWADLNLADVSEADLSWADLSRADLSGANLFRADLGKANLVETNLSGADLGFAMFFRTSISECDTLHLARNLQTSQHDGSSCLDPLTLRACVSQLPDLFLQGVGYTLDEINYLRAFYATPIQVYSCFLSHASADAEFVERLRTDLLAANVNCWHFRHDMQGGRFWRAQIDEAIKVHDKLVLVCSEQSLQRENVVAEVIAAIDREREQHSQKLFPIRLDDYILGDEVLQLADGKMAGGQWPEDWVRYVRRYHIPDFSRWKDHDAYQGELAKLLRDLKEPPKR